MAAALAWTAAKEPAHRRATSRAPRLADNGVLAAQVPLAGVVDLAQGQQVNVIRPCHRIALDDLAERAGQAADALAVLFDNGKQIGGQERLVVRGGGANVMPRRTVACSQFS